MFGNKVGDTLIVTKNMMSGGRIYLSKGTMLEIVELYRSDGYIDFKGNKITLKNYEPDSVVNLKELRDDKLKELLSE